jgi:low temperature requirement protein LtrA
MSPPIRIRMTARSSDEPHRTATALELLFDLTFVIAIAVLTGRLAHAVGDGHALDALVPFLQVFFAIWWAWMNYTWFASSFDTDDVAFRLLTLLQMAGVLVLAAGVPAALDEGDYRAVTLGYVIMRLGLIVQWLRAGIEDPLSRPTALRYAAGISIAELAWLLRLALDEAGVLSGDALLGLFVALVLLELAIPLWAERRVPTTWHPHHIAERYGLFAIILFGEGIFAASTGVERALAAGGVSAPLITIAVASLVLVFALWWLYFLHPTGHGLVAHRDRSYLWGYGHYGIYAALAAVGGGLEIAVEQTGHPLAASPTTIAYAIAIPCALFLILAWALHAPLVSRPVLRPSVICASSLAILLLPLAAPSTSLAAVVAAIALTCAVAVALTIMPRAARVRVGSLQGGLDARSGARSR